MTLTQLPLVVTAVLKGTLKEQELYPLIILSLLIVSLAFVCVVSWAPRSRRSASPSRHGVPMTALAMIAMFLALGINPATCM